VKDQEKPEHIADRFYKDINLHWIVLLFNDIIHPYFEWPMSELDLENHIKKQYPGQALYIDNTLYKSNLVQTWKKSDISFGPGCTVSQGAISTTILSWNSTLRCLVVSSSKTFQKNNYLEIVDLNGRIVKVLLKRIVYDNTYALHHFEDSQKNILDPNLNPTTGILDGTLINAYINESNDNLAVVNREYETAVNDAKRNIRLLKPKYVQYVIDEFTKVIER
jgi:hypothetical protein